MPKIGKLKSIEWLFIINFVAALSAYFLIYINSNFLNDLIGEELIGVAYSAAALITIVFLVYLPKLLKALGNYVMALIMIATQIVLLLGLAFIPYTPVILGLFLLYGVVHVAIVYHLDIFLEHYSPTEDTGEIRGKFLTISSTAVLISPLIVGLILGDTNQYWKIYFIASLLLIPTITLVFSRLKNFVDPPYGSLNFVYSFRCLLADKNLLNIFIGQLILRIFFSWMVIYMPIYLHAHIGLPWSDIGIIFTIMLIPYVILEIPLGKAADDIFGEKELLVSGFIILGLSTMVVPFIVTTSIIVWSVVLFMTRIGASMIEIMTESYFFKHVGSADTNTISIFRMARPISTIIGPLLATMSLLLMPLQYTFLVVAALALYGVRYAFKISDTR